MNGDTKPRTVQADPHSFEKSGKNKTSGAAWRRQMENGAKHGRLSALLNMPRNMPAVHGKPSVHNKQTEPGIIALKTGGQESLGFGLSVESTWESERDETASPDFRC